MLKAVSCPKAQAINHYGAVKTCTSVYAGGLFSIKQLKTLNLQSWTGEGKAGKSGFPFSRSFPTGIL